VIDHNGKEGALAPLQAPVLTIKVTPASQIDVRWQMQAGYQYYLETSTNLPNWDQVFGPFQTLGDQDHGMGHISMPLEQRFYRVRAE
jgi:hypothetical protein